MKKMQNVQQNKRFPTETNLNNPFTGFKQIYLLK